jgi:hypothetical protein
MNARDVHDAFVVAVPLEQLLAESEECGMRHAVVFQHDQIFHLLECGIQAGHDTMVWSEIDLSEVSRHLAIPIHALDDLTRRRTPLGVAHPRRPRSVGEDEQTAWLGLRDLREHTCRALRTIEDDEGDRRLQRHAKAIQEMPKTIFARERMDRAARSKTRAPGRNVFASVRCRNMYSRPSGEG